MGILLPLRLRLIVINFSLALLLAVFLFNITTYFFHFTLVFFLFNGLLSYFLVLKNPNLIFFLYLELLIGLMTMYFIK
jgi:hypothetical protein